MRKLRILGLFAFFALMLAGLLLPSASSPVEASAIFKGQTLTLKTGAPTATNPYMYPNGHWDDSLYVAPNHGWVTAANIGTVEMPVPCAGAFWAMNVTVNTATTQGSWTFTMYKNGVATDLSVVMGVGETSDNDYVHHVDVVPGDMICWRQTQDGAPTDLVWIDIAYLFVPTTANETIIWGMHNFEVANDSYSSAAGYGGTNTLYGNLRFPDDGVFRCIYADTDAPPDAVDVNTLTLYINGVSTGLVITQVAGTSTYSDTGPDVAVSAGQQAYWRGSHNHTGVEDLRFGVCYMSDAGGGRYVMGRQDPGGFNDNDYSSPSQGDTLLHGASFPKYGMIGRAAQIVAVCLSLTDNPGAGESITITLTVNGVDTTYTATVDNTPVGETYVVVEQDYELNDLDRFAWKVADVGSCGSPLIATVFEPMNILSVGLLSDFIATPVSSSQIDLSWHDAIDPATYPELMTEVRFKLSSYPGDPPSSDSTQVYYQPVVNGNADTSHTGLSPGTTYYYRIWLYDTDTGCYELCDQDFATTYAGPGGPDEPFEEPSEWFQDPTCDMYANTPLMAVFNSTANSYTGMPVGSLCLICTMAFIGLAGAASYPLASRTSLAAPRTVAVPFAVVATLVTVAAIAQALPLYFLFMVIVLVGLTLFLWTRV